MKTKLTVEEAKLLLERRCHGSASYHLVLPGTGAAFVWPNEFSGDYSVDGKSFPSLEAAIREMLSEVGMLNE